MMIKECSAAAAAAEPPYYSHYSCARIEGDKFAITSKLLARCVHHNNNSGMITITTPPFGTMPF